MYVVSIYIVSILVVNESKLYLHSMIFEDFYSIML